MWNTLKTWWSGFTSRSTDIHREPDGSMGMTFKSKESTFNTCMSQKKCLDVSDLLTGEVPAAGTTDQQLKEMGSRAFKANIRGHAKVFRDYIREGYFTGEKWDDDDELTAISVTAPCDTLWLFINTYMDEHNVKPFIRRRVVKYQTPDMTLTKHFVKVVTGYEVMYFLKDGNPFWNVKGIVADSTEVMCNVYTGSGTKEYGLPDEGNRHRDISKSPTLMLPLFYLYYRIKQG